MAGRLGEICKNTRACHPICKCHKTTQFFSHSLSLSLFVWLKTSGKKNNNLNEYFRFVWLKIEQMEMVCATGFELNAKPVFTPFEMQFFNFGSSRARNIENYEFRFVTNQFNISPLYWRRFRWLK